MAQAVLLSLWSMSRDTTRFQRSCSALALQPRSIHSFMGPEAGLVAPGTSQCFADAVNRPILTFVIGADQQLREQSEAEQLDSG